jgi:hypothetical protein
MSQETPAHVAATEHAPYDEKPQVQVINESLTNQLPTGYAPHDGSGTDRYPEADDWTQTEGAGLTDDTTVVEEPVAEPVEEPTSTEGIVTEVAE